jgi:hypothetical protein
MSSAIIRPLQALIEPHLAQDPRFAPATVIVRRPKQTLSEVETALAQLKLALLIFPPLIVRLNGNVPGWADDIEVRVRIVESPVLNDSGTDAYDLVEGLHAALMLHQFPQADDCDFTPLVPDAQPTREIDDPDLVVFDIVFHTSGGLATA